MSEPVWVRMTITISGGRADGRDWPDRWGDAIDLPEEEALPLIRAGNAIQVDPPEAARPLPPPASQVPAPQSEPAGTARGPVIAGGTSFMPTGPAPVVEADPARLTPVSDPHAFAQMEPAVPGDAIASTFAEYAQGGAIGDDDDVPPLPADGMNQPKPADPKQAWVDYAMAHGETEDEANMQTKAQLMSKYGGRL
jgi:hypothetical protein